MFKKTDDSEWSRFSRALSSQSKAGEEAPTKEQVAEPAPQPREAAAPAPAPAPASTRPAPAAQTYPRVQATPSHQESDEVETIIGVNSSFDGTLRCDANMRIKGSAQGEIACAKSLFIEESAQVNAKVTAANATVAGKLDGSITCEGRLEILATGQVTGELAAGVLIIQEGAFFEGHLKMKERRTEDKPRVAEAAGAAKRFGPAGDGAGD